MKPSFVKLLTLLLALVLTLSAFSRVSPVVVRATESDSAEEGESSGTQAELDQMIAERVDLKKQIKALERDIENNTDEIDRIAKEKKAIDQQIGLINQDILLLNRQVNAYGQLIADKQEELDEAQAHLLQVTEENRERIRTMEEDGTLSYWSVLFRANDFADLLDRLNMVEEIAAADHRRLESMRAARREVEQAQEALNAEKVAVEAARAEVRAQQELLAEKRLQSDQKLLELKKQHEDYEKMLEDAENTESKLQQEIAEAQKELDEFEYGVELPPVYVSTGNGVTATVVPPEEITKDLIWLMPCEYTNFASPWGWRMHPVYDYPRFHDGVDLGNEQGTPIYATRAGKVVAAHYNEKAGYFVSVNHGDGFISSYMHMTHFVVRGNQEVEAGELLGYMGSTGVSTGPHLHFGLSWDGYTQNPADFLPLT